LSLTASVSKANAATVANARENLPDMIVLLWLDKRACARLHHGRPMLRAFMNRFTLRPIRRAPKNSSQLPIALSYFPCNLFGIERSRCRGIEVVAAVTAASSSVAGALGMNRPVQTDQR